MKQKLIITLFIIICCHAAASGQNKISSTVEVKREYEGKLIETVKTPLSTHFTDTLLKFNLNFDYSTFDRTYRDLYEFSPMRSAHLSRGGDPLYPWLYLKVGAAYPLMPSADLYIQPRLGERSSLLFYYNHDSFWGKIPFKKDINQNNVRGDRMVNRGGVEGRYLWEKVMFELGVDYSNNYFTYYGFMSPFPVTDIPSHTFDDLSANIRIRSTNGASNAFFYDFGLRYDYLRDRFKEDVFKEHAFDINGEIGLTIQRYHKVLVGIKSFTDFFCPEYAQSSHGSRGYVEISPKYRWEKERWRVKAGVSVSFPYSDDASYLPSIGKVLPDASVSFEAARNALWIYAGVEGDNRIHSYASMFRMNPWITTRYLIKSTTIPVDAHLGLKGVIKDKFSYDVFGSFSLIDDMAVFASDGINGIQVPYFLDNRSFNAGVELQWKSKDFLGRGEFGYHYYLNDENAIMLPSVEAKLIAEYNFRKRFFIKMDCAYTGPMKGMDVNYDLERVDVPGFVDLKFNITYARNDRLSFYIEGNNLINNKIQYHYNYILPGINFGLGMCLKL